MDILKRHQDHVSQEESHAADLRVAGYDFTAEQAANYMRHHGFQVAPRTISWHCQTNLLDCQKFTQGNVLKWKITKQSLDERIETLKREGNAVARNNAQVPASLPAGNSEQQQAPANELATEIINVLRGELDAKNKQISEFQSIIKDHNKQFENLNQTIQLSNETIQQLNKTLALPQVKHVMDSMRQENGRWRDSTDARTEDVHRDKAAPDWTEEK